MTAPTGDTGRARITFGDGNNGTPESPENRLMIMRVGEESTTNTHQRKWTA